MADQEKDRQLDQLLDSALAQYSAVEPRPGLETRILARIADSRSAASTRAGVLRWLWTGAAAAALAAIILFSFFSRPATRSRQLPNTVRTQPQPQRVLPTSVAQVPHERKQPRQTTGAAQRRSAAVRQAGAVGVRQKVFPTPVALSEQEALLLRYLSHTPREELLAQAHPDPSLDDKSLEDQSDLFVLGVSNQINNIR